MKGKVTCISIIVSAVAMLSVGCNQTMGVAQLAKRPTVPNTRPSWMPRPKLDLTKLPELTGETYLETRSAKDWAAAAAHLAGEQPAEASQQYLLMVEGHGGHYEPAYARNSCRNAIRCAWDAGDPVAIQESLSVYDARFDLVNRLPEPEFIAELNRFFKAQDGGAAAKAYQGLERKLPKLPHPILESERSRWLKRHEDAVLKTVLMYRDLPPSSWSRASLDSLIEAEVALVGGNVHPGSEIFLFAEAERLVRKAPDEREADSNALITAIVKVFLTRTGLVRDPGKADYLVGHVYRAR